MGHKNDPQAEKLFITCFNDMTEQVELIWKNISEYLTLMST